MVVLLVYTMSRGAIVLDHAAGAMDFIKGQRVMTRLSKRTQLRTQLQGSIKIVNATWNAIAQIMFVD